MAVYSGPSKSDFIFELFHFASSWEELISCVIILSIFCLHLQAKKLAKTQAKNQEASIKSSITASDFRRASPLIVSSVRRNQFYEEMGALKKQKSITKKSSLILPPFLDEEKGVSLLHVGGRSHRPSSRRHRPSSRRCCPSSRRHSRRRYFRRPRRHFRRLCRLYCRPRVGQRRYFRGQDGKKSHHVILPYLSLIKIGWRFSPPSSPLSGGRSIKADAFHSLAVDADGPVDPRPPAPLPNDSDDFDRIAPISPLCPLHCGPEQPRIQTSLVTNTKTTTKTLPPPSDSPPPIILHRWRHVRILANAFWYRTQREFVSTPYERHYAEIL